MTNEFDKYELEEEEDTHFLARLSVTLRQKEVRASYMHGTVQWSIAFLIIGNFVTNVVEKQIDPWNVNYTDYWFIIECVWNSIFIVELAWNMWGCVYITQWRGDSDNADNFFRSPWNLFDLLVVGVSIPSMTGTDLGSFSQLRMLRAFRVFRLFKRIKSLNRILVSLIAAVPGLFNAAIVMILFMCIFSILAVDLFGKFGEDGYFINLRGEEVPLLTVRNLTYGDEYYGNFFRALFSLFQVLTGESWSEAIARPVVLSQELNIVGGLFYVVYIIVCGIVLVNVAVAVLLEKMVDTDVHNGPKPLIDRVGMAEALFGNLDESGDGALQLHEFLEVCNKELTLDQKQKMLPKIFQMIEDQLMSASRPVSRAATPPPGGNSRVGTPPPGNSRAASPVPPDGEHVIKMELDKPQFVAWLAGEDTADISDSDFKDMVSQMQIRAIETNLNRQVEKYVEVSYEHAPSPEKPILARASTMAQSFKFGSSMGRSTQSGRRTQVQGALNGALIAEEVVRALDARALNAKALGSGQSSAESAGVVDARLAQEIAQEIAQLKAEQAVHADRMTQAVLSLTNSVGVLHERMATLQERFDSRPAPRPRKPRPQRPAAPGAQQRPQQPASGNGASVEAAQIVAGEAWPPAETTLTEDRMQDGEVAPSKQAPGRMNSAGRIIGGDGAHDGSSANGGGGANGGGRPVRPPNGGGQGGGGSSAHGGGVGVSVGRGGGLDA